jgi:hypothetical protein
MPQANGGTDKHGQSIKQPYPRGHWVSVVTMFLVLVYTGVQIWQTMLIRRNNVVSQRAFLFVGNPAPVIGIGNATTVTGVGNKAKAKAAKTIVFMVPVLNSGNTATKDFSVFLRCARSVDTTPEPWTLLNTDKTASPNKIGPHETAGWPVPRRYG